MASSIPQSGVIESKTLVTLVWLLWSLAFFSSLPSGEYIFVGLQHRSTASSTPTISPFLSLLHRSLRDVTVARLGLLPLSGLMMRRKWVMVSTGTAHHSRSNVESGGEKLYSCLRTSLYRWPPSSETANDNSCVLLISGSSISRFTF